MPLFYLTSRKNLHVTKIFQFTRFYRLSVTIITPMRITFYWAWLHPFFFVKTTHASGKDLKKKKNKKPRTVRIFQKESQQHTLSLHRTIKAYRQLFTILAHKWVSYCINTVKKKNSEKQVNCSFRVCCLFFLFFFSLYHFKTYWSILGVSIHPERLGTCTEIWHEKSLNRKGCDFAFSSFNWVIYHLSNWKVC